MQAQGLTVGPNEAIKRLIIDPGKAEHNAPGRLYVAISRAQYLDCIAFSPMPKMDRFKKLNRSMRALEIFEQLAWYDAHRSNKKAS